MQASQKKKRMNPNFTSSDMQTKTGYELNRVLRFMEDFKN